MPEYTAEGFREGDVETWYEGVAAETFASHFVPLSKKDALAIIAKYHQEATPAQEEDITRLIVRNSTNSRK